MHRQNALVETPTANYRVAAAESQAPRWELDAAQAVLARVREELAALAHDDTSPQQRAAVQRRLQSAQQLVARINSKMAEDSSPEG